MSPEQTARDALAALGLAHDELCEVPADAGSPFIASTPDAIVYVARGEGTRRRLRLEAGRLASARAHGVPVPEVLGHGEEHLVVRRVRDDGVLTGDVVDAVVQAVDRLAAIPAWPAEEDGTADGSPQDAPAGRPSARAPWQRVRAAVSFARLGVSPGRVVVARREALALPDAVTVHGDLQPANIMVALDGTVHLIDLELAGRGPAGWDLATLWPMLEQAADRDRLLAALDERTPDRTHRDRLLRWLTLRYVGDLMPSHDPRLSSAMARWREVARRG